MRARLKEKCPAYFAGGKGCAEDLVLQSQEIKKATKNRKNIQAETKDEENNAGTCQGMLSTTRLLYEATRESHPYEFQSMWVFLVVSCCGRMV